MKWSWQRSLSCLRFMTPPQLQVKIGCSSRDRIFFGSRLGFDFMKGYCLAQRVRFGLREGIGFRIKVTIVSLVLLLHRCIGKYKPLVFDVSSALSQGKDGFYVLGFCLLNKYTFLYDLSLTVCFHSLNFLWANRNKLALASSIRCFQSFKARQS